MDRGTNEDQNKLESTIKVIKLSKLYYFTLVWIMSYILLASEVIDLEDIDDLSDEAYEKFTAKIETRI